MGAPNGNHWIEEQEQENDLRYGADEFGNRLSCRICGETPEECECDEPDFRDE